MTDYLSLITRMKPDATRSVKIGRWNITITKQQNGSIILQGNGSSPCCFGRAYEAAQHLHSMVKMERDYAWLGI